MMWHRLIQDTRRRPTCCQLCCMGAALVPPVNSGQLDPKIECRLELVQQRLLPLREPTHEFKPESGCNHARQPAPCSVDLSAWQH